MTKKGRGLGKGLQALIPKSEVESSTVNINNSISDLTISSIVPNPSQPRTEFTSDGLQELADSIKEHGFIQPIVVRQQGDVYELIAGERRWRAAKLLQLEVVPAIIKEVDENKLAELALIENIQREDLNPIDEAMAYKKLLEEFNLTQDQLAKRVGKSRPFISNMIRVLSLPARIQKMVSTGQLSIGHARALLSIEDRSFQIIVAEKVARNQLSVRQTEELVKSLQDESKTGEQLNKKINTDPVIFQTEDKLKKLLGTKVKIKDSGGKGRIEIEYYNDEDFNRILDIVLPDEIF